MPASGTAYAITAKAVDTAGNTSSASAALFITVDTTAPTAVYAPMQSGGDMFGGTVTLNMGDNLFLDVLFNERVDTSPTVQFKYGSGNTDFGSAITAANAKSSTVYYAPSLSADDTAGATAATDTAGTSDGIDFGVPPVGSGVTREAVGSGYVYKVLRAVDTLSIRATANFSAGAAFRGRYSATKPTASTMTSAGTQMWNGNSGYPANFAEGAKALTNVAANTYFWFYPTDTRTVSQRTLFIAGGPSSAVIESFSAGSPYVDAAGPLDPINFADVSGADFIVREDVSSGGYVYKVTKNLSALSFAVRGHIDSGAALRVRRDTAKPNLDTVSTAGTLVLQADSDGQFLYGSKTIYDVTAGTYLWFYLSANRYVSNRSLVLTGVFGAPLRSSYTASHTIQTTDPEVAAGNLKYDITNESSVKDPAGNVFGDVSEAVIAGYAVDHALHAIVGAVPSGSASRKDITISEVTGGAAAEYKLIDSATCNAAQYGADAGTALTLVNNRATVTVADESGNNKYLCLQGYQSKFHGCLLRFNTDYGH